MIKFKVIDVMTGVEADPYEIARRCGMHRHAFYCDGMMNGYTLAKFCAVTKVSADWLLGLRRNKNG